VLLAIHHR
jgi:hypothetical protein